MHLTNKRVRKTNRDGFVLYQICASRDIPSRGIKKGKVGGWVDNDARV